MGTGVEVRMFIDVSVVIFDDDKCSVSEVDVASPFLKRHQ